MNKRLIAAVMIAALAVSGASVAESAEAAQAPAYTELQRGAKGDEVIRLQERLAELGYYAGKVNGKYDSETEKAVKRFRKDNGLSAGTAADSEVLALLYGPQTAAPVEEEYVVPDYDACMSDPDGMKGTLAAFEGTVVRMNSALAVSVAESTSGSVYYVVLNGTLEGELKQDAQVAVKGTLNGLYHFMNSAKAPDSMPFVIAESVVVR